MYMYTLLLRGERPLHLEYAHIHLQNNAHRSTCSNVYVYFSEASLEPEEHTHMYTTVYIYIDVRVLLRLGRCIAAHLLLHLRCARTS